MAHIQLLGTGGTIASRSQGTRGAVATEASSALVPKQYGDVTVRARDILTIGSYRLDLADLRRIAEAVGQALADPDTDGVVVTHGTDTLEETAFLLDLVHASPKPVVVTGAQRTADSPDADGPRNVAEAVRAAADERLRGAGALICFNGTVRSARGARKVHTTAGSPFGGGTEVAHMAGNQLVVTATPRRYPPLPTPPTAFDNTRVEIITAYPGATPELLDHAVQLGSRAVVLAGTGVGNAGPGFAEAVKRATGNGCIVVLSTRAPWGPVVPTYGDGGGIDLVEAGAIPSADLNPFQARILTAVLLSYGEPPEEFPAVFESYL
ncbi:asparaginase [Arthrobacter sulfonylureivorans]|uniref:asparaginase n=1 Tax=Arthrobacter sulfonylureivorans TaxID=2486855 RepID=A0ABY3WC82_9MICC|nr:asparaginase [Arthrobacter sulfonylureivorans]UNK46178.1 asparaginase [Arthrobacter sulfonylureivorans]